MDRGREDSGVGCSDPRAANTQRPQSRVGGQQEEADGVSDFLPKPQFWVNPSLAFKMIFACDPHKGCSIVNDMEVDVFLESLAFSMIQ